MIAALRDDDGDPRPSQSQRLAYHKQFGNREMKKPWLQQYGKAWLQKCDKLPPYTFYRTSTRSYGDEKMTTFAGKNFVVSSLAPSLSLSLTSYIYRERESSAKVDIASSRHSLIGYRRRVLANEEG